MRGCLADRVGATGMKRRRFALRWRRRAEHFRGSGLIKAGLTAAARNIVPKCLEQTEGAGRHDISGVLGLIEADANVRLSSEIVDLVRLDALYHVPEPGGFGHI